MKVGIKQRINMNKIIQIKNIMIQIIETNQKEMTTI
jgi:hypothetical protein